MSKTQETGEVLSDEDQVGRAALILASWKYKILEPKTFNKLQKMKTATLSEYEPREDPNVEKMPAPLPNVPRQLPEPGKNIDATRLPDYPPLPGIRARISKISPPFLKQLTGSDVSDNQSRLSLTKSFAKEHYLPMLNGDEDLKKGVRVTTYGPDGCGFPMDFKIWAEGKTYVLTGGWMAFCSYYKLKPYIYWVTVWMFRDDTDRLCFALDWSLNDSTTKLIAKRSKGSRTGK